MTTKILTCSCKHDYQDEVCGKQHRVHNRTKKHDGKVWRCTVCCKEQDEISSENKGG